MTFLWLACAWQVATDQVAAALKVRRGALIQSVPAGSAAAKAGLLPTRRGLSGLIVGVPLPHHPLSPQLRQPAGLLHCNDDVVL